MEWSTKAIEADGLRKLAEDLATLSFRSKTRKSPSNFQDDSREQTSRQSRFLVSKRQSTGSPFALATCASIAMVLCNLQLMALVVHSARHEQIADPEILLSSTHRSVRNTHCRNFSLFCFAVPRQLLPGALVERPRLSSPPPRRAARYPDALGHAELCLRSEPNSESLPSALNIRGPDISPPGILEERSPERVSICPAVDDA